MRSKRDQSWSGGMTKLEVVVVLAIVAVLLALLLPALQHPYRHLPAQRCQNNLMHVGLATRMWAGDNDDKLPWEISTNKGGTKEWLEAGHVYRHYQALSNELGSPKVLVCHMDTNKIAATNFHDLGKENVSYFVGTSARLRSLPNSIMGGDPHLVVKTRLPPGVHPLTVAQKVSWDKSMHGGYGAIVLSDGSAYRTTKKVLQGLVQGSGLATNWVVLP
jgi:hypothetical protein